MILFFFFFIVSIPITLKLIKQEQGNLNRKIVNCYDKYGNVIKNQTCITEPIFDSITEIRVFYFISAAAISLALALFSGIIIGGELAEDF